MAATHAVAEEINLNFKDWIIEEYEIHGALAQQTDKQFILCVAFQIDAWENSDDPEDAAKVQSLSESAKKWYEQYHGLCCEHHGDDYINGLRSDGESAFSRTLMSNSAGAAVVPGA